MNQDELLKNIKILYVEDDAEAREELFDVLKRRAGKVIACENGVQGAEIYAEFEPDIVITDLYMPEMNGIEMIKQIRQQAKKPPAVVVISAVGDVDTIFHAIDAGIDKYVLKPVDLRELLDTLCGQAEVILESRQKNAVSLTENKKQTEEEIRREFAALLKTITGKGPRDVSVFIGSDRIEITASEVLTVFEKNLLDNCRNIAIIKYIRELFFSVKEKEICELISRISGREVGLKDVLINAEKDKNKLIFTVDSADNA